MDKHTANTIHALRRAKERYGLDLKYADLQTIVAMIECGIGRLKKVKQISLRRAAWIIEYGNEILIPVLEVNKSAGRKNIVTFLPRRENYEHLLHK
jgi:hypothetical protein